MIKSLVLAVAVLSSASVFAQSNVAQLASVDGQILVNGGEGFQIAVDGTSLQSGSLVSVAEGASGFIVFQDGCRYELQGGTMATVPEGSPCAGYVVNVARIAPVSGTTTASVGALSEIPAIAYVPIAGFFFALGHAIDHSPRRPPPLTPISP